MNRAEYMDTPPVSPPGTARAERERETLLVSYTFAHDVAPEFTETYDIAVGGLAMFTNAALQPNLEIIIDLELRGNTQPNLRLHANVRWSAYDPMVGKFRTGVSFVDRPAGFERDLLRYIDTLHRIRNLGTL